MKDFSQTNLSDKNFSEQSKLHTSTHKLDLTKAFYKRDVIVYIALFILVVALFLIFVLPEKNDYTGFRVCRNDNILVTCYFEKQNEIEINQKYSDLIEHQKTDDGYLVKIYKDASKTRFNVIYFNLIDKTAKITESNCSERKDCFWAPAIKDNGSIYCSPHDLLIKPIHSANSSPITG